MSSLALAGPDGKLEDPEAVVSLWRDRITQAREHRKQFEPVWLSNLAFAAGQHYLAWDERQRRMRHLSELDPFYDKDLFTADVITEQRAAALGELATDDDRPELLLAQQSDTAEALQKEINAAVAHGWEYEWGSDQALRQARRLCIDLGVSAVRVRFDPTLGPLKANVPTLNGKAVTDINEARALLAGGPRQDVAIKDVHEGRTVWEPLSALNLLTPPGVNHETAFPWEVIVRPVLIDKVEEEYGDVAKGLSEDGDIASIIGLSTSQQVRSSNLTDQKGRLRGHVWLFTCNERPTRAHPQGQVVVLASNAMRLLRTDDRLAYETVEHTFRSGVHYLHWWRLNDRFWSRSFVEGLKDPQRMINRRKTQSIEIGDRSMPFVMLAENSLPKQPTGTPMEYVTVRDNPGAPAPVIFEGHGPGEWMYRDVEGFREDLSHASTMSDLRMGDNPAGVNTYSQLALLNENESLKREEIQQEHKDVRARLVEDSVHDIRRFWPEEKLILVAGDEGSMSQQTFSKSKVPDFYLVKVAKGSAKPRSQGAELKKIDAIWLAATQCGVFAADPHAWIKWYSDSLEAGQSLELPEAQPDSQTEMANFENFLMQRGEDVEPADYDLLPTHVPIHREAQDQARAADDVELFARIQTHVDRSIALAQSLADQHAAQVAASAPPMLPPDAPPGPPGAPSGPPDSSAPPPASLPPSGP
jgi:hypothetical protein